MGARFFFTLFFPFFLDPTLFIWKEISRVHRYSFPSFLSAYFWSDPAYVSYGGSRNTRKGISKKSRALSLSLSRFDLQTLWLELAHNRNRW